ncbi:MAG: glycosyltransferase family 4 protein [Promethearchaeota archaeon]
MYKILRTVPFFSPAFGYGGPVVHTLNVSEIQVKMGHDVRVLTTNILTHEVISSNLPRFEIYNGIKIHRYPIKFRLGKTHYFITPTIINGFLKYDYDIIHSHSYRTFQTDMATVMSKIKKKPFVFTAHGTLREMYLLDLLAGQKSSEKRMKMHDLVFKKIFLNNIDRVIVHSYHEKLWTMKFNIPEEIIRVIPHGVDIKKFSDLSLREKFVKKFKVKEKMILYVGRLLRNYRNVEYIIKIMKDLIKEYNNVKFWLVGHSYDKEYEMDLKKLVKSLDLDQYVNFITTPTREDIIGAYQTANMVVFPMTNSDGFGIPLLEAGAARCPIISTNRGPAPELVINGKTGFLTEIDNIEHLKEVILKILTDEELERKLGEQGHEHVVKNYTWEIVVEQTNKVYEEIL